MKKEIFDRDLNVGRIQSETRDLRSSHQTLALWPAHFVLCIGRASQISLVLVALAVSLPAASTNAPVAKASGPGSKNDSPPSAVLPPPPQSVFVLPKRATEGKDPFFPTSTRVYNTEPAAQQKTPVISVGNLSLKGISGTALEPLAIINTTTFTTGEENDVITSVGRMRVRCVEINMERGTALVQVGGERRELRLQSKTTAKSQ